MTGILAVVAAAYAIYARFLALPPLPVDPRANVLIITLDTTRADRIGAYGYDRIETPQLDALASDGVRFERASSSVPLTLPAHTSLFTGVHPPRHGVRDNGGYFLDDRFSTLAEVLQASGRRTFAAVGAFVLNHLWGLGQGFEVYEDEIGDSRRRSHELLQVQRDGAEVVRLGLEWLDEHAGEPFFVWLHLYDPHYPYEPPGDFARRYAEHPYDGEIAYTDSLVGRVLERLRQKGLYDSTLIVVIGDHGESLGEHHEPDHGVFLYESTLHIPLIIRAPDPLYRGVVQDVVREIDVMPTVLQYVGINPPSGIQGASLLGLMAGRAEQEPREAYSESRYCRLHYGWAELAAIRGPRYKLIDAPRPELYDLVEDPREQRNIHAEHPDIVEALRARLEGLRQGTNGDESGVAMKELDTDTLAKLMSLGYAGSLAPEIEGPLADPKDKLAEMNLLIRASRESSRLLEERRFAEVVTLLETTLSREPNYMDGYLILASAYHELGRADREIETLDLALRKTPENVNAMQGLARAHMHAGDNDAAATLFETIIARSPRYPQAYFGLAELRVNQGRFDEARQTLEKLLEQHPGTAVALYEMGMVHLRAEQFVQARDWIARALAAQPRLRNAHFNLALIAERDGDARRARAEYEQELALFPRNVEAEVNLGLLCAETRDLACAERAFSGAVEHDPESSVARYLLARTYIEKGRLDGEVLALARRAVELDPSSERARRLAGQIEAALARGR